MSLAFSVHSDAFGIYPDGGEKQWAIRSRIPKSKRPYVAPFQHWGWSYQLLPYIEETAIWELPTDGEVLRSPIGAYFCPSRRPPQLIDDRAMMDYAANGGTSRKGNMNWGMMGNGLDAPVVRRPSGIPDRSVSVVPERQIEDGTSKTLLLGEKCLNAQLIGQRQADDDSGYVDGWDWDNIRWGFVPPAPDWYADPSSPLNENVALHSAFGSSHPGLFNAGLCDGSVSSITYDVDLETFKRASSRNDGQVYQAEDLQ
jgi:hypothetical protein